MSSTLKLLGLGRCTIGLLRKNLLKEQGSDLTKKREILFDHHYILNLFTCTQSNVSDEVMQEIGHYQCTPNFQDQLHCLDRIKEYQICVIEVFPASRLYFHKKHKFSMCFESFTKELQNSGFGLETTNKSKLISHLDPEAYITNLSNLIEVIRKGNKLISIILLNGELLYDQAGKKLSSPFLHKIMKRVKSIVLKSYKDVSLLDINDTLSYLSKKHLCFFETEFPLLYIRHQPDLEPIEVARDCKHASLRLRHYFTLSFYNLLIKIGYSVSDLCSFVPVQQTLPYNYEKRAVSFLSTHNKKKELDIQYLELLFKDSRILSQYTGYVLITKNMKGYENLRKFIQYFASRQINQEQDLITYLYHIRTLTAYLFTTKEPMLTDLCLIGMRVLSLPRPIHSQYSTYVLLWLKNICLAAREIINYNKHISAEPFSILLQKLKGKDYLHNHEIIRQLLVFENISGLPKPTFEQERRFNSGKKNKISR